jgi:serine protease
LRGPGRWALGAVLLVAVCAGGSSSVAGARSLVRPLRLPAPSPRRGASRPKFDAHSLLVRFKATVGPARRSTSLRDQGAALERQVGHTGFAVVDTGGRSPKAVAKALRRDPSVADVELNYVRHAFAVPNDPLYPDYQQAYLDSLRLPAAWDESKGSDTGTIAIVDTGVDLGHPDLAAHVLPGYDFVNGDSNPQDDEGHGTMVTGIAAALTDNGHGIAGVAWNARILPVKVLDDFGEGTDSDVAAGITYAADHGASVINLSLGGPDQSDVLDNAVAYARNKGAVVVAAAGNDGLNLPEYPAASPGAIAVAATGQNGDFAWFSNYGPWVDTAAPGIDITSTYLRDGGTTPPYATGSGTSFAAPMVAGAALLIRAAHPGESVGTVEAALKRARDSGPRGIDDFYGAGFLDAYASVGGPRLHPSLPAGDDSEPNDSADAATPLTPGSFTSTISPEGDVDWYAVDLPADTLLSVGVRPQSGAPYLRPLEMDPALAIYSPERRLLSSADFGFIGEPESAQIHAQSAGRYLIRVSNDLGSRSPPGGYDLTVAERTPPPSGFEDYQAHPLACDVRSTAIGDVNGDGLNDVVASVHECFDPEYEFSPLVFEQLPDGSLADPYPLPSDGQFPDDLTMAVGDLNGDGIDDIVLDASTYGVDYYRGGFNLGEPPVLIPGTEGTGGALIANVYGTSHNELVLDTGTKLLIVVDLGHSFTSRTVTLPMPMDQIAVGDVTGDGRPDIVTTQSATVYVYAQQPDETFAAPVLYGVPTGHIDGLGVGDVTGDAKDDVALSLAGNQPDSRVAVMAQSAGGTLSGAVMYPSLDDPEPLGIADMTGDGRQDVVTVHGAGFDAAGLYSQTAGGSLGAEELLPLPYPGVLARNVSLGDVNGDGRRDIVYADSNNGLVVVPQVEPFSVEGDPLWVRGTEPADRAEGVSRTVLPSIRFARPLDPSTVSGATVKLVNGLTGGVVSATVSFDVPSSTVALHPAALLAAGATYVAVVDGVADSDGEPLDEPFSFRFTTAGLDTAPPDTFITSGPTGTVQSHDAEFTFNAGAEAGAVFECSLDGGMFRMCLSPKDYRGLPAGTHTFGVRAADDSGNTDPSPASRGWTIATAGPPPPPPPLPPPKLPPACIVPKVTGMTLPGASRRLRARHCSVGVISYGHSRRVAKGRVIRQHPAAHRRLANRGRVNLVVSSGRRR